MIYTPKKITSFEGVVAGESQRQGGFSQKPYSSLNLGLYTTDNKSDILKNRTLFFEQLGFSSQQTAGSYQIHSDAIKIVESPGEYDGFDALISQQKNILLTITVADCTPVLIYDPIQEVVAAIHAGWKGTIARLTAKTIATMQNQFGSQASNCVAYIGSCIGADKFETDADVADHFQATYKKWDANKSKFFIDLKSCNRDLLLTAGVKQQNIEISPYCTYSDNDKYFSYRKEKGTTGRMLVAIGMQ